MDVTLTGPPEAATAGWRYPGWRMVAVGMLLMTITFGIPISVLPMVYAEVMKEFNWSMTQTTFAFSLKQWTAAAAALFIVAPLVERVGVRVLMIASCVVTGAAMASFLLIESVASYNIAVLSLGFGQSFTMIGVKLLVSRWFTRRQGLAVGIALAGSSLGGSIFPLVFTMLAEDHGWRMAMASLSLSIWLIALPAYLLVAREKPTESDIAPEALKSSSPVMTERLAAVSAAAPGFKRIVRSPAFWFSCIGITIISGVDGGLFQHTALFITKDLGMSKGMAAAALSGTFALGVVSKIAAGWVFDVLSIRGVQLWWILVAIAILMAFTVEGALTLAIFASLRGVAHGGLVAESPVVAKHAFGPKSLNQMLPIYSACLGIGGGLGPLGLAILYDHYGSYSVGLVLIAALAVFAAALMFFVPPTYRKQVIAASRA